MPRGWPKQKTDFIARGKHTQLLFTSLSSATLLSMGTT
jgi:hypothetical protein